MQARKATRNIPRGGNTLVFTNLLHIKTSSFLESLFFSQEREYQICLGNGRDGGGKTTELQRLSWRERARTAVLAAPYPSKWVDFFLQVS